VIDLENCLEKVVTEGRQLYKERCVAYTDMDLERLKLSHLGLPGREDRAIGIVNTDTTNNRREQGRTDLWACSNNGFLSKVIREVSQALYLKHPD
jgi:hypothetical protein